MLTKISCTTQKNNAYAFNKQNQKSQAFQGILTIERDLTKKPALLEKVKDTNKVMTDMAEMFSNLTKAITQVITEEDAKPIITSIENSNIHQINFESNYPLLKNWSEYLKSTYSLFDIKVKYKD